MYSKAPLPKLLLKCSKKFMRDRTTTDGRRYRPLREIINNAQQYYSEIPRSFESDQGPTK